VEPKPGGGIPPGPNYSRTPKSFHCDHWITVSSSRKKIRPQNLYFEVSLLWRHVVFPLENSQSLCGRYTNHNSKKNFQVTYWKFCYRVECLWHIFNIKNLYFCTTFVKCCKPHVNMQCIIYSRVRDLLQTYQIAMSTFMYNVHKKSKPNLENIY
jgi:hypothetical protein